MTEDAYLRFLALVVLVFSTSGVVVGAFWGLPSDLRAYRYWKREENPSRSAYAFWRLVRTALALSCLVAFVGVGALAVWLPDDDPVRQVLARHLVLYVVLALTGIVVSGPVSERRIDAAIAEELGVRNASRDAARDSARDCGRDPTRDAARDEARDEAQRSRQGKGAG